MLLSFIRARCLKQVNFATRQRRLRGRRPFVFNSQPAVQQLEDRVLLTAQVTAFDGSYSGSYSGTETHTDSSGNVTISTLQDADGNQFTAVISNGTLTSNAPGVGAVGTATVNAQGGISGSGTALNIFGQRFPFVFSGTAQSTAIGVTINGTFSWNQPGDVGQGTWTLQSITPLTSPVLNVPAKVNVNENNSVVFSGANAISATDTADGGNNNEQVTMSVNNGTLTLVPTSGSQVEGSGTAILTISGTVADLNADLANLIYTPTAGTYSPDALTATIVDTTDQVQGSSAQVSLNVAPTPPTAANYTYTVNENQTLTVPAPGVLANDTDPNGLSLMAVSFSAPAHGTLTPDANGDGGFVYAPFAGVYGPDSFTYQATDGPATSTQATVTITVNSPPVVTAPKSVSVIQNSILPFAVANAISVADPSGTSESLTLSVKHGTLSLVATDGLPVTGNGTKTLVLGETLSTLDADLATLAYTPTHGYKGSDKLSLSDTDTSDGLTGTASVAIAVNAVKKTKPPKPIIKAPSTASVEENAALTFSATNGSSISLTDAAVSASSDSLTLTVTHGKLTLGSTNGLTFSAGSNGSASMTIEGALPNLNAALIGLTFTPSTGYSGSASLAVKVTDVGDKQTGSATVAITVVVPSSQSAVTVGTPVTTAVPGEPVPLVIEATDTYAPASTAPFSFTISFGDGSSTTTSCGTPLLVNHVYKGAGTFTVTVTATDEFGHQSAAVTETINIVPAAVETNPFNTSQTALLVGTSGKSTILFAASDQNIAVTLNGIAQGTFSTNGPLIIFGQGGKDNYTEGAGVTTTVDLLESPTADDVETDLDNEALQWAGLIAATKILNA
jgi:hypothetical protein